MKESDFSKIEKLLADYPHKDDVLNYIKEHNTIENEGRNLTKDEISIIVKKLCYLSSHPDEMVALLEVTNISRKSATSIRRKVEAITSKHDKWCDMYYDAKTHTAKFDPTAS